MSTPPAGVPCTGKPVALPACTGLWHRSLLATGEIHDTSTDVRWLQGRTRYVDLRRPASRPDFTGVRCAAELTAAHRDWLATQDGFAGAVEQRGDIFQWNRTVELTPPGPHPDAGRMYWQDDILVEVGVHADYLEHWQRETTPGPVWALELSGPAGTSALLVRAGTYFGWARDDRENPVEIALGRCENDWTITDSALPYREWTPLHPRLSGNLLRTSEIDHTGRRSTREWTVRASEGDPIL
ncbi:hypothetical protein [Nocardia sp. alder85J]|uniref:hypothetical protein n=1 Tax=Nocardia sp. alder85J TaxID=2862949 RepID=UPI001CD51EC2|nr:hypothetical protein [Nocardia sp. alder85J]MCX4091106.1 hypothetical protein [Nocardia sp. alder85J]